MGKSAKIILIIIIAVLLLCVSSISIRPIRDRIAWQLETWRTRIYYAITPPEDVVFLPIEVTAAAYATLQAEIFGSSARTPTPFLQPTFISTPVPDISPTPLPAAAAISGVTYQSQHGLWNYCAPATLAMGLSYWGWVGDRTNIGQVVKPVETDKNVMMTELADYVNTETQFKALYRYGGDLTLLKSFVASGFPVVIEKGTFIHETATGRLSWMGHYNLITGYDDNQQTFIVQDAYFAADYPIAYALIEQEWSGFNNIFLVVYPPAEEARVQQVLGVWQDVPASAQIAAQAAYDEISNTVELDQFFAWYNLGSSMQLTGDSRGAAAAFDTAFQLYPSLPPERRPFRVLWYRDEAYQAYYTMARYQQVIDLATATLDTAREPCMEESLYWRGVASRALGDIAAARADLEKSLECHPGYRPSQQVLIQMGNSN
ncbi:MAG: C39 family peptidase [Anaerolineaceae bacterium]|nr:C39 family peptidase [Anaerolineaceae bacterium]